MPIEAMTQVGMYKQQKYDEGLQKIQNNIETIAGLDVYKPLHKQYLQSKLNELGGKLKTVAAGDFSNFQLVNSVGGMATQIGKDPIVQNAVMSTQKIRKNEQERDAARKEGKDSPSNNYVYNLSLNEWMEDQDLSKAFSENYTPYTNWKKNGLEVLKSLTKDSTLTEDAFTVKRDAKGNVVLGPDGKPQMVLADAIVKQKYAGLSPEKIQQALMVGLTPADFKQMEIDGVYSYANVTPEKLRETITTSHVSNRQFYENKKSILETAKLSTNSEVEKDKLDQQIAAIDKAINNITNDYNGLVEALDKGNVKGVKAQLYTKNAIADFSKAFSFTETEQEYKDSPFVKINMERQKMAADWKKFTLNYEQQDRQFRSTFGLKVREVEAQEEANRLKKQELTPYGPLSQPIPQEELPKYNLSKIVGEVRDIERSLGASDDEFAKKNKVGSEELEVLRQKYYERPGSVDGKFAAYFAATEPDRRRAESQKTMILDIEKKAKGEYGDITSLIPANAPSLNYRVGNSVTTFTPKDFVDFNSKLSEYIVVTAPSGPGGRPTTSYNDQKAKKELSAKEYQLYQIEKKRHSGQSLTNAEKVLTDNMINYNKIVNIPYQETLKKVNTYIGKELTNRLAQFQGVGYAVLTITDAQRRSLTSALGSVVTFAESQKGNIAGSTKFDLNTLKKLIANPGDINTNIRVVEGTSREPAMYEVTVMGKDGTSTQFKLTPQQKVEMFGTEMFEASPNVRAIRSYQEQIMNMGGTSTASDNSMTATPTNSYLSNIDFTSVQRYGIKGNVVKVGNNMYTILGTIYDPITRKWRDNVDLSGIITEENINAGLKNLNDGAIYTILNNKVPTANDLKQVEEASKKPF